LDIEEIEQDLSILVQRRMALDGTIAYLQDKLKQARLKLMEKKEEEQIEE